VQARSPFARTAAWLEDRARALLLPRASSRPIDEPLHFMFTIDTEISLGGALEDHSLMPVGADRRIWGQTESGRFGIELFMDVFEEHGLRGVFFLEPFGSRIVDPRPLEEAARLIVERGHDVELHLHPEFRIELEAARKRGATPSGLLHDYPLDQQQAMIREAADLIERWTGERPIAFRAGSFGFDQRGADLLFEEGFLFDSSYNLWAIDHGLCGFPREPALNDVALLPNGLLEAPVTNLMARGIRGGLRNFDLASLGATEMIAVIEEMWASGARVCTSLTHSFRLLYSDNVQYLGARLDPMNLHRVRALCRWLNENRDRVRVSTYRDLPAERWRRELSQGPIHRELPSPPAWASAARLAVQAIKDRGAI
jgi:hypothetical protein